MALPPAEKQRGCREWLKADVVPVHTPRPRDRRSRSQRWCDAVAELRTLQEHYRDYLEKFPDALCDTSCGERLQVIADVDI